MSDTLSPQMIVAYTLCLIILLPLVPAVILFMALPSSQLPDSNASVEGPFHGLKIKLGGAFAGYFVMVMLVFSTHSIWNPPDHFEVWDVEGQITDDKGKPLDPLDPKDVSVEPAYLVAERGGRFRLQVATRLGQGGSTEYPTITVSHGGDYSPITIDLDPTSAKEKGSPELRWDDRHRRVRITNLALKALPAYGSTNTTTAVLTAQPN